MRRWCSWPDTIGRALQKPCKLKHRSSIKPLGKWRILDDCYNANPQAMKAALDTVSDLAEGKAVAVLGQMLELGSDSERFHTEVGAYAAQKDLQLLITVGAEASAIAKGAREAGHPKIIEAVDVSAAAAAVIEHVAEGAWILFKASRGAQLEKVIEKLGAKG